MSSTINFISKQNHVKRPPNSFILWSSDQRYIRNIINKNKSTSKLNNAILSKLLGDEWVNVSEEIKLKYKLKADERKLEHKIKFPDYKYRPKHRLITKPNSKRYSKIKKNIENIENIKEKSDANIDVNDNDDDNDNDNDNENDDDTSTSTISSVSSDDIRNKTEHISIVNKRYIFDIMNGIYIINASLAKDTIIDQTMTILMDHILADKTNFNLLTELEL